MTRSKNKVIDFVEMIEKALRKRFLIFIARHLGHMQRLKIMLK